MKTQFKKMALGAVLAGSMIFSAGVAMARDNDYSHRYDNRYYNNGYNNNGYNSRYDRGALENAKNQLNYDLQHRASRKQLAQDQAMIDQILSGNGRYDQRGYSWWPW